MDTIAERAFTMAEAGAPDAQAARETLGLLRAEAERLQGSIDWLEATKAKAEEEIVSLSGALEPVTMAALALARTLGVSGLEPR
ncbi:MAG: hypothetical protein JJU26_12815 [Oceanicaulis sp.]|nr:hypothetical protein [Oceanicaulis sp.]